MLNRGKVFVVSGPSGAGKTTILTRFLKEDKNSAFSVSYTTRQKREGEREGIDYHFVTRSTFEELIRKGFFLEWEEVHGEMYGTPKEPLLEMIEKGIDVFMDLDVNGAMKIKRVFPQAILIFIQPPSEEELIMRLKNRKEKAIIKRLERLRKELEAKRFFDYVIINDSIEKALSEFKNIVEEVRSCHGKNNG
ncbi:MAG: guanylate kinase [Desulfobacterota bacterium]|nr:guanylate kinase [Thermodesulfobacteriota bacterium]MDW8001144.1 guanylate kinase [Deltaproteobacteria bacterium]